MQFTNKFYYIFFGFLLFVYLIVRAIKLPMTCDEVKTCLEYSRYSMSEIISYSRSPVPNNHILHTLLVKLFTEIFGMTSLVCRLPNILGFVMYYYFVRKFLNGFTVSGLIDKRLTDNRQRNLLSVRRSSVTMSSVSPSLISSSSVNQSSISQLSISQLSISQLSISQLSISLLLLVCNPYFLDFFSLARGYGLACAFMLGSIYFALSFLKNQENKQLFVSAIFGLLSVYTNFTTLNFYVAICFLLGSYIFFQRKNIFKPLSILFSFTTILAALCYLPITRMRATNQFVFWGTKGFYEDTFKTLTDALMYGSSYFGAHSSDIFRAFIIVLLFIVSIFSILEFRKNAFNAFKTPFAFAFMLLITTVIVNMTQHYLIGTPYLQTRTALFFFPLGALPIVLLFQILWSSNKKVLNIIALIIGLPMAYHFFSHINTRSCYEWWYDADTKKVLTLLETDYKNNPEKKKIKLATHSWMMPSFLFHIEEEGRTSWIQTPESKGSLHPEGADYYYTFDSEQEALKKDFDLIKNFGGRVLMKRKK